MILFHRFGVVKALLYSEVSVWAVVHSKVLGRFSSIPLDFMMSYSGYTNSPKLRTDRFFK